MTELPENRHAACFPLTFEPTPQAMEYRHTPEVRQFKLAHAGCGQPLMTGLMIPDGLSAKEQYMGLRANRTGLVLDQLAFYAADPVAEEAIKGALGLTLADWTVDEVTGEATVWDHFHGESRAKLQFNYDLGIEVEILTYLEGPHWHQSGFEAAARDRDWRDPYGLYSVGSGFISHIGFHVNDGDLPVMPLPLAQELITHTHTNPGVAGRRYHYRIYDARAMCGCFLKYIKRIG